MPESYRLAGPLLRALPPEQAHRLAIQALRLRRWAAPLLPAERDDPVLASRAFGLDFANPIGLAAGFDKDAEAFGEALSLGFGFVEVGSVTPLPQPGNSAPRLFRLPEDQAVINRLGFNSRGLAAATAHLQQRSRGRRGVVGVNLGKNRDTADAGADYCAGIAALAPFSDYLVINVSSPNTPGLRALQAREQLARLIERVQQARRAAVPGHPPPLLVKIAPDLKAEEQQGIAEVALATGLDGLIVGNTTVTRPKGLRGLHAGEVGGLSGRPLFQPSTALLAEMYRLTGGRIPLIGVGGVASGADAYAKIRAGASLVQLYTALLYQGPGLVRRVKRQLAQLLRADRFARLADAVGADHRRPAS